MPLLARELDRWVDRHCEPDDDTLEDPGSTAMW